MYSHERNIRIHGMLTQGGDCLLSWRAWHWGDNGVEGRWSHTASLHRVVCCLSAAYVLSYIYLLECCPSPAARFNAVLICCVRVSCGVCLPSSCTPTPPPPMGTPRSTHSPCCSRLRTITTMPRILKTKWPSLLCLKTAEPASSSSGKH